MQDLTFKIVNKDGRDAAYGDPISESADDRPTSLHGDLTALSAAEALPNVGVSARDWQGESWNARYFPERQRWALTTKPDRSKFPDGASIPVATIMRDPKAPTENSLLFYLGNPNKNGNLVPDGAVPEGTPEFIVSFALSEATG
jgi:hypothetical protein